MSKINLLENVPNGYFFLMCSIKSGSSRLPSLDSVTIGSYNITVVGRNDKGGREGIGVEVVSD